MKPPEFYKGREQTYVKHLFLGQYLERVAYNIGSFRSDFVYVDGFSGPWRSEDEQYADTSFGIAVRKLQQVRDVYSDRGKRLRIRCFFIEKDPTAFRALDEECRKTSGVEARARNGEFESLVQEIIDFVGVSFSLIFVDPTGWAGFGLNKISPLLGLRGEMLVNFMYNDINRHLEDPRPEVVKTFDPLFGGSGWQEDVAALCADGLGREEAVVETYRRRFKAMGNFPYVTTTRILNPLADRTYFYLIYGTRHRKGLLEFRGVEKKVVDIQERVREAAKIDLRTLRSAQSEFFGAETDLGGSMAFQAERGSQCDLAFRLLRNHLIAETRVKYEDLLDLALEHRLVWQSDLNDWLVDRKKEGQVEIEGLKPRERIPKIGHSILWLGPTH